MAFRHGIRFKFNGNKAFFLVVIREDAPVVHRLSVCTILINYCCKCSRSIFVCFNHIIPAVCTRTRIEQLTEEGHYTGGIVAFGYKRVQKGRLNKKNQAVCDLEINEEEAAVVRLIFQKYVYEGYGAKRICNYLVEHNIMGRNGKNIPNITIGRMIRNKGYTGYLINGNVEKECPELRIIEPEVFEKAQELRDARRREKGEDADSYSPHALLCGKVFCAHCGNRLNITSSGRTRLRADGSGNRCLSNHTTIEIEKYELKSTIIGLIEDQLLFFVPSC